MLNLETKIVKAPLSNYADDNNGSFLYFIYNGLSMSPTFKPGQHLCVKKGVEDISIGDVIIFQMQNCKGYTVHRVVSASDSEIFTKGDNNSNIDRESVDPKRVIGRVEALVEDGKKIKFNADKFKLLRVQIRWFFFDIKILLKKPLRPVYRYLKSYLKNSRILKILFSRKIKKIILTSSDGEVVKFLFKGHTVAQWWPEQDRFLCKKPFDLFISKPDVRVYKEKYTGNNL